MIAAEAVCAIVVTHDPDPAKLAALLTRLEGETDVILFDNASPGPEAVCDIAENSPRIVDLHLSPRNIGLAAALNHGLRTARAKGYAAAILFDQDSLPSPDYARHMTDALVRARQHLGPSVIAVGPRLIDPRTGRAAPFRTFARPFVGRDRRVAGTRDLYHADALITSGKLIDLALLAEAGEMDESLFIDNIDLDWCFRVRAQGYRLAGTDAATLAHRVGRDPDGSLASAGPVTLNSPERSFYTSRNRVRLYRRAHVPLAWKLCDVPRFAAKTLWLLALSPERWRYLGHSLKGVAHGLRDTPDGD